jgi:hypothetical protein
VEFNRRFGRIQTVGINRTVWPYIPEDKTRHSHCCENNKSNIGLFYDAFLQKVSYNAPEYMTSHQEDSNFHRHEREKLICATNTIRIPKDKAGGLMDIEFML